MPKRARKVVKSESQREGKGRGAILGLAPYFQPKEK